MCVKVKVKCQISKKSLKVDCKVGGGWYVWGSTLAVSQVSCQLEPSWVLGAGIFSPLVDRPFLDWDPYLWSLEDFQSTGCAHSFQRCSWWNLFRLRLNPFATLLNPFSVTVNHCWELLMICGVLDLTYYVTCSSVSSLCTWIYPERFAICAHCSGVKGRIRQVGPQSPLYDVILGPDGFLLAGHAKATSVPANRKPAFSPVLGMILFVGPARQKEKSPFSGDCIMCCTEAAFCNSWKWLFK